MCIFFFSANIYQLMLQKKVQQYELQFGCDEL